MALTKTPIELSSTPSIVDNGNATAITIGSDESVALSGTFNLPNSNATNEISFTGTEFTNVLSATTGGFQLGTTGAGYLALLTNNTEGFRISAAGQVTMPSQPAFSAKASGNQSNIPINANTTVLFGTELFDQGSNFASNTFTAPITGRYQLNVNLYAQSVDSAAAYIQIALKTSNRLYYYIFSTNTLSQDAAYMTFPIAVLADMDASDTAYVEVQLNNTGAAQMDITANSHFSGYLVA